MSRRRAAAWRGSPRGGRRGRGAVVLVRRRGEAVAFEAKKLKLVDENTEGTITHTLNGIAADGSSETILFDGEQAGTLEEAGRWLAGHAEIPFTDSRTHGGRPPRDASPNAPRDDRVVTTRFRSGRICPTMPL